MFTQNCYECFKTKPIFEFDRDSSNENAHYVYCRSCRAKFKEIFDKKRKEYIEGIS